MGRLKNCNCYIITVPTSVDAFKRPDLTEAASEAVSTVIDAGDIVIFESTVYPTVTEDSVAKSLSQIRT